MGGLYLWALQSEDLELGPKRSTAMSPGLYPKDQFIFCRGYLSDPCLGLGVSPLIWELPVRSMMMGPGACSDISVSLVT